MTAAPEVRTTSNSLRSIKSDYGNQNPQVTSDVQRNGSTERPEESTHAFTNPETTRSARGDQGAEEVFEKARDPAGWNTREVELTTNPATFQKQGPRIKAPRRYQCHDPLATTPMLSHATERNQMTSGTSCPAPKESDQSSVTRASRVSEGAGLAATTQIVAEQPQAPAPMEGVSRTTPARRATQAAANDVHDTLTGCPLEVEAGCYVATLLGVTTMVMAGSHACIFGLH